MQTFEHLGLKNTLSCKIEVGREGNFTTKRVSDICKANIYMISLSYKIISEPEIENLKKAQLNEKERVIIFGARNRRPKKTRIVLISTLFVRISQYTLMRALRA